MKKTIILFVFIFATSVAIAQDFRNINDTIITTKEGAKKAEPKALEAANWLLTIPSKPRSTNRAEALRFINIWMLETDIYDFDYIQEEGLNITEYIADPYEIYLAAIVKVALENRKLTKEKVVEKATFLLGEYCAKKVNKVKAPDALKKRLEKLNKG